MSLFKKNHLNLFKTFTFKWWQAAVFKVGMLGTGIVIGAYWHALFGGYLQLLIILAVVSLVYVSYVWWKQ
jgi:hypothetical protein